MMRLTDHEAAIWAAAFVQRGAGGQVSIEVAAHAVLEARRLAKELSTRKREGAVEPEAAHMLREMVNRSDANRLDDEELGDALAWLDHRHHKLIAGLLRAEYGIFEDEDGYVNGSLGTADLARQLDIHCPGCGSQAVWLRSDDGRQWRCGNIGHIGFKFEVEGVEAILAKEWYAAYLGRKFRDSSRHNPSPVAASASSEGAEVDNDYFDDEDPEGDFPDDDSLDGLLPGPEIPLSGQGFRNDPASQSPLKPDFDPLGQDGGPLDPGKLGR